MFPLKRSPTRSRNILVPPDLERRDLKEIGLKSERWLRKRFGRLDRNYVRKRFYEARASESEARYNVTPRHSFPERVKEKETAKKTGRSLNGKLDEGLLLGERVNG